MMQDLTSSEVTELLAFNYIDSGQYKADKEKEAASSNLRKNLERTVKRQNA